MNTYPIPENESKRLEKLQSYNILDTPTEAIFDDLTKMVSKLLRVPIVLVTLVDKDRQWFKSKVGLAVNETPRVISFCQYAILQDKIFEVENAQDDERFKNTPLVIGKPNIAFYAGAPLTDTEGFNLGTLCVIDIVPRKLSEFERSILTTYSKTIINLIQFREKQEEQVVYHKFFEMAPDILCVVKNDGYFKLVNPAFTKILGWSEKEIMQNKMIDFIHPDDVNKTIEEIKLIIEGVYRIEFQNRYKTKEGGWVWLEWTAINDQNSGERYAVARNITTSKVVSETKEFLLTCGLLKNDEDYFQSMAKYLAQKMNVSYVCIEKLDQNYLRTETLVVFKDRLIEKNVFYTLKGTPCEKLLGKNFLCYPSGVAKHFPTVITLQELKAESFAGSTLFNSQGVPIGLITVIGQNEMSNVEDVKLLMDLIKPSISFELDRRLSMESIQKVSLELSYIVQKEQAIINSLTTSIAVLDENGTIIQVNESWCRFADENQLENNNYFIGANYITIAEAASGNEQETGRLISHAIKNIIAGKENHFFLEYPCHSPSKERWFNVSITALKMETTKGVVVAHENITERKLAEQNMNKAMDRYHIISNATSDTVYDWDMVNDVVEFSDGITKTFGYHKDEIINTSKWWNQNLHPDDRQRVVELISNACKAKQTTLVMKYQYLCSNRTSLFILERATIIYDELGKPTRMFGSMRDITIQQAIDLQMDKAIVESQEKDRQLLGMELHDNVIQLLAAGLIYQGMAEEKQKNKKEFVEMLEKSAKYVNEAIIEIRKLSHQLAPAALVHFSLQAAFQSLVNSMNMGKGLITDIHVEDLGDNEVPHNIQTGLYRILQEQLNNVYKHAEASTLAINLWLKDNCVYLEIKDDGKGFDLNNVKNGIGLQNMKRRAKILSGNFTCATTPGNGCLVHVQIPLHVK